LETDTGRKKAKKERKEKKNKKKTKAAVKEPKLLPCK